MKKIVTFSLLLCMILALTACGKVEITMQEIYDAVQTEALLKNHQSVYIRDELDGEILNEKYLTNDYAFDYVPDPESEWAEFMTDNACYSSIGGDYVRFLPIDPDGVKDGFASYRAEHYASVMLGEDTTDEIIESVSEKDGRITVTSVLSQETLEIFAADGVTAGKFVYVLDAETREMIAITGDYTYEGGATYRMASEISYDANAPEMVKTFLAYENQTENLRNITVVSNPGTEKEVSQTVQVPKGLIVGFRYDEDTAYVFEPYIDAACTESYDPYADTDSDLTIYINWVE